MAKKVTAKKVYVNSGGYIPSMGYQYVGVGEPVYQVSDGDNEGLIRAKNATAAKKGFEKTLQRYANVRW